MICGLLKARIRISLRFFVSYAAVYKILIGIVCTSYSAAARAELLASGWTAVGGLGCALERELESECRSCRVLCAKVVGATSSERFLVTNYQGE